MFKYSVSLIIPMYNVEEYIDDCLYSALSQNDSNYEIIIIDDGSTDSSFDKARKIVESSSHAISIYQKANGGLSDARNYGLAKAEGEYIIFIDSDDYVSHSLIEYAMNAAKKTNADIVCFALAEVTVRKKKIRYIPANASLPSGTYKLSDANNLMSSSLPNACNKLIRKKLFTEHNIEFPKGLWYEDLATNPKLFYFANQITFIEDELYYYRQRDGAITKTFSLKVMDIYDVLQSIKDFFALNTYKNAKTDLNTWYINLTIITLARLALNNGGSEKVKAFEDISKHIANQFPNPLAIFQQAFSKKRYKIFALLIRLGFIKIVALIITQLVKKKVITI